jgi:hypothetical protein
LGTAFPEAELHQNLNPDGSIAGYGTLFDTIRQGARKRDYTNIRVPILAITWYPLPVEVQMQKYHLTDAGDRAAIEKVYAAEANITDTRIRNVQSASGRVRVVTIPGANHYVFISSEPEVLREMNRFVAGLN